MSTLRIRMARPDDDAVLGRLDRDTWSTLHAVMPKPEPPYAAFFDGRFGPPQHLVAEIGDGVVGFLRLASPTPLASMAHVRQIQGLVVAERARGEGVGRRLLREACEEARRQGARRITLRVLGHNAPARALYESEGFTVEGVLPGEIFLAGEYVDDFLMGRPL